MFMFMYSRSWSLLCRLDKAQQLVLEGAKSVDQSQVL
jgi:hypothetical protein